MLRPSWTRWRSAVSGRSHFAVIRTEQVVPWAQPPVTSNVRQLILYEPGLGLAYPTGAIQAIEKSLAAGDREAAIFTAFGALALIEDERDSMRSSPLWPVRLASAPTLPRECRTEESWTYRPGQFDAVTARTLMLTGSETPRRT